MLANLLCFANTLFIGISTNASPLFLRFLSLSSQGNNPELPESHHWPVPHQNMFHLQRGQGPGLPVLRCQCLGAGYGLSVGIQNTHAVSHVSSVVYVSWCQLDGKVLHFFLNIILLSHPRINSKKFCIWSVKRILFFFNTKNKLFTPPRHRSVKLGPLDI